MSETSERSDPSGPQNVVVVGAGLAAARIAEELRGQGYPGPVTLLGAEDELPYSRPPLSKGYLQGKSDFTDQLVHDEAWYAEHDIEVRRGTLVTAIHPQDHTVELSDGSRIEYGALVLATGAEPRRPPIEGVETALVLRTKADSDAVRATFGPGRRLAIVGGGWVGLEVAAAARLAGTDVTLLESGEQPLLAVMGAETGAMFAELHRAEGVDLRTGSEVTAITATSVTLEDGTYVEADAVVLGAGVQARSDLAEAAGIAVDGGVLVDSSLRTSDPDVWAVGDVANHDHPILGRLRVEHWTNANFQPPVAVDSILGGSAVYDRLPKFTSAQYDLALEYVGFVQDPSRTRVVTRGEVGAKKFATFFLDDDDRVLAVLVAGKYADLDDVRPLIEKGRPVDADALLDPEVDYADVVA